RPAGPSAQTMVQLSRLKSALEAKQQDIDRMVGSRGQQLSEAQGRLTAALTIYTEDHPTVLALRQTVGQLSRDSPELVAARRDARDLEAEYDALSVKVGVATEAQSRAVAASEGAAPPIDPLTLVTVGDETEPVSLRQRGSRRALVGPGRLQIPLQRHPAAAAAAPALGTERSCPDPDRRGRERAA